MTELDEVEKWAKVLGALTPKQRKALVALLETLKG